MSDGTRDVESNDNAEDDGIHDFIASVDDPLISSLDEYDTNDVTTSSHDAESSTEDHRQQRALLQAIVFVEDAIEHRSVFHKVDAKSLSLYRTYHSRMVRWILRITIMVLLILAFIEWPSSLTKSAAPLANKKGRPNLPCGVTEAIELICLIILTCDFSFKVVMIGKRQARKSKWLIGYFFVLAISYLDLVVSLGFNCNEPIRIRRALRPFFLLQNSSVMKKTVQSIKQTIPEILSVLFLFGLHLYFFTMFGMILFPRRLANVILTMTQEITETSQTPTEVFVLGFLKGLSAENHPYPREGMADEGRGKIDILSDSLEGKYYFQDLGSSMMSLIILLTTANNPDVMMPAYHDNRLYSIYFIAYLGIGLYFFMNMLLAVIYNQFRGSFMRSMQGSFFRRRLGIRAAFEVLRGSCSYGTMLELPRNGVGKYSVKKLLSEIRFSRKSRYLPMMLETMDNVQNSALTAKQFQAVFDVAFEDSVKRRPPVRQFDSTVLRRLQRTVMHSYFQYFGDLMAFLNVFLITVELVQNKSNPETGSSLVKFNLCFIIYYAAEQILLIFFIGRKRYFAHKHILFEFFITFLLVIVEIVYLTLYGAQLIGSSDNIRELSEKYGFFSAWNLLRISNMLIIVRLFRIIPSIKPLSLVAGTLSDLVKNMRPFGGVIVVIYYLFAIFGMMIFENQSPQPESSINHTSYRNHCGSYDQLKNYCGSYQQLEYYANNFDDFGAALVVLWDVMVVNNWHVFLRAYKETTNNRWSQAYFVLWWFVSVVICANLLIALVLEAFFTQFERNQVQRRRRSRRRFAGNEETTPHFRVHQMFRNDMQEPTEDELLNEIHKHHYLRPYVNYRPLGLLDD